MRIYNTMTRSKEVLETIEPGAVRIYACGPTVYNFFHLGNARPFITFDTLRRFLEYVGYDVTFVQNFTDIDDKVIRRANEEGLTFDKIASRYIDEYYRDADGLGIKRASIHPKATDSIQAIIEMVERLMAKGHAYLAEDGVYFKTRSFPDYGKLSRFKLDELEAGRSERLELGAVQKQDPADFVLWKFKKDGEPFWASPWGDGRPGWHIECSAMIHEHLDDKIDIHCGGQDLIFPHHENEIAQSRCACGGHFARYWMHNGFINIDNEKMSKSLGNFFTVRDLTEKYAYKVLRYFMLTAHYRSPINFSEELLRSAQSALERVQTCYKNLSFRAGNVRCEAAKIENAELLAVRKAFKDALDDDLNTPDALAVIFDFVRRINQELSKSEDYAFDLCEAKAILLEITDVLGLDLDVQDTVPDEVLRMVDERTEAKKARDFAKADALRATIMELGYEIMDTPQGPKVNRLES